MENGRKSSTPRRSHGREGSTSPPAAHALAAGADAPGEYAGVRLSHPDKVLYPGQGITKEELAAYYMQVADWMLPHVIDRPLAIVRCPEGSGKPCFF